jgi:hypothetical protein
MAQAEVGLRGTFELMGGVAVALLVLSILILAIGKRRRG